MMYGPCWDLTDPAYNFGTIQFVSDTPLTYTTFTITLSTLATGLEGVVNHLMGVGGENTLSHSYGPAYNPASLTEYNDLTLGELLTAAAKTAATSHSWPSIGLMAVELGSDGIYTFSHPKLASIEFSEDAGAHLFGFSEADEFTGTSIDGEAVPDYLIVPTLPFVSLASPEYEPAPMAVEGFSDLGTHYTMAVAELPLHRDWVQQYESAANTIFPTEAFCPFHRMFQVVRTVLPFVVYDGFSDVDQVDDPTYEVFYFRPEGSNFGSCVRASEGNGDQFHISFKCYVVGTALLEGDE